MDIRTEYFSNTSEERNRYTNTGLLDMGTGKKEYSYVLNKR